MKRVSLSRRLIEGASIGFGITLGVLTTFALLVMLLVISSGA